MAVANPHELFRAIFDHDAEAVQEILTDRPDLIDAWMCDVDNMGSH